MGHHGGSLLVAHIDAADAAIDRSLLGRRHGRAHDEEECVDALLLERTRHKLITHHAHGETSATIVLFRPDAGPAPSALETSINPWGVIPWGSSRP
jgi:hypothetical protein